MEIKKTNTNLIRGIRAFFHSSGKKRAVLGLSGGVDSSLVCSLLAQALGPKNVTGLILPLGGTSTAASVKDAQLVATNLGVKTYKKDLSAMVKAFSATGWNQSKTANSNTIARIRAILLYNYANSSDCLVAGTGNRTELTLGYFTKYGDGAVDFLPIGGLWKKQVYELASYRTLPLQVLAKTPSAELWKGQTDEKELGLPYSAIDDILGKLFDKGLNVAQIVKSGHSKANVGKILVRIRENAHKTTIPLIINP
ncbi:MAG: NAD+ synthase [archaeon]|nr:NAD+ synthase [archaeon]